MVIKIDVKMGNLLSELNSISSRLRNPERGMRKSAFIGLNALLENFVYEGSGFPNRRRWQSLKPSTMKERARKLGPNYASHPILTRTGKLRNSIRYKAKRNILTYYTQVKYAQYHVTGTSKIPERNFMLLNQETVELLTEEIINWMLGGVK